MRALVALVAALLMVCASEQPAFAWGADGHQYVGNVAWALLNSTARTKVTTVLGKAAEGDVTLADAAVWPDCIRNVKMIQGQLQYVPSSGNVCAKFAKISGEKDHEINYAMRNWTNCQYAHKTQECHKAFHFADVAIQHTDYRKGYYGTGDQDVVSAIQSAILVLEKQPPKPPFNFEQNNPREALLLLAHFVGDVHQPLHVGAIYLTSAGKPVNPDAAQGDYVKDETAGGNFLKFGSSELHADWDDIVLGTAPDHAAICDAAKVKPVAGALLDKPAKWATESVQAASKDAFPHLSFSGAGARNWTVSFEDRSAYSAHRKDIQRTRLILAGARLAEVLNALFPGGTPPALSCP